MFSWLVLRKRFTELEREVRWMKLHEPYHLHHHDLDRLYDLVCKHRKWEDIGISQGWHELRCQDCGKVIALSCPHGGSCACQACVDEFIKRGSQEEAVIPKEEADGRAD